jgi:hypothetical protein
MRGVCLALGIAAVLAASVTMAQGTARNLRLHEHRSIVRQPLMCVALCAMDTSPCDPPEYKRTDGRCNNPVGGGGWS